MNKINITIVILLITAFSYSQKKKDTIDEIQAAYMKSNKKMIDEATPMIDYFLKYQDTSTTVTQGDFNKLMTIYNVKESKGGLTKEQAFSALDIYTKDKIGGKENSEDETIDEAEGEEFPKQSEEEELLEKAKDELPGQIKSILTGMSYDDFKELFKITKPNASEAEIRSEYKKMQNSAKGL